jgi:hypothetical protein
MPGRRIQIDYDGEILDMDWDRPEPPTQKDVKDWMQRRRSIKPNAPPPGPADPNYPDPDLPDLPDEYKSLQLPEPKAPTRPDTGFLGGIGETLKGIGHFASNVGKLTPSNLDFSEAGIQDRARAAKELIGGVTEPFMQGGREAYGYEQRGEYGKALGRSLAAPVEAVTGIPVTGMARDIGEGRYGHAIGSGLIPAALTAFGARGGKKTAPVAEAALPDIPPVRPEPVQMPMDYGFDQPGLPFREPPPTPTTLHGPEIGPYGVHDPTTQPILQPVIGKQKLGFDAQPTMPWDIGPEAGLFPEGKPKVSGTIGPEGEVIPGNEFVADPRPKMGPPVGTFDRKPAARPVADKVMGEATEGPVAKAAASGIPELQDAAQKTTLFQRAKERAWKSPEAQAAAEIGKSNIEVIKDSGKAGRPLAMLLERTRLLGEHFGGDWTNRAKQATAGLTPEQIKIYVESRDKGIVPNDPAVQKALEARAIIDKEVVQAAKDSGAGLRTAEGKIIPFRERINHWPHIYDRKKLAQNKDAFIAQLEKEGWTTDDAAKAVENAAQFGERLVSAQHERQGNAPGFRMDLDADYMHLNDMGKRIAEARELGPRDIADPTSPIEQLIRGTDDPKRIREIISTHLGRDVGTTGNASWTSVNNTARKVVSAAHLSHFAISNFSQMATTPLRANLGAYTGALKKVVTDWKKTAGEAEASGALQTINQDLLREVGGEGFFSKAYGMKKSETLNRTVSSVAGKATAESLFQQLKKDPTNKRARARLENLVLEPVDKVLKQDALTKEQLGISGGRMSQITQGRAQSIDLPKVWSEHPIAEIPLIFKKYAFTQTRIIRDAVMENPGRNIPLALALYATMGEAIGDVKAGVKGTVSGVGPGQAIADRGEGLERVFANLGQAWALGILTDLIGSGSKASGLAEFIGGPVISDIGKAGYGAYKAATDKPGGTGRFDPLKKQVAQAIPFVGSGIAAQIGGGSSKSGLPRPPRASSSLPRVPRP